MMKKTGTFLALFCIVITTWAGHTQTERKKDTLRPYSVRIVDRKGKPIEGLVVSVTGLKESFLTDKEGLVAIEGISDADSIMVFLPHIGEAYIPCKGTDSIQIAIRSKKRFRVQDRKEMVSLHESRSNTISDVPELLRKRPARDLAELLQGQIPGLFISLGPDGMTANIRGVSSILSRTEPLIVIDGMAYDSFSVVNSFLDVNNIQSIQVQKDGGLYGVRGANGVIIITTIGADKNPLSY